MYMSPNNTVPDHLRYSLLTNPWTPPDDYSFPVVLESGKKENFKAAGCNDSHGWSTAQKKPEDFVNFASFLHRRLCEIRNWDDWCLGR